jgi:hypothetical protein
VNEQQKDSTRKKWVRPEVRTATAAPAVFLVCTGQVDCDALLGLGYTCCQPTEAECNSNC